MIEVAPSMLSADFSQLKEEIHSIEEAGASWLHIDVMDGHFVPNLTFGAPVIASLRPHTDLVFDVHLMVTNPSDYIEPFRKAGAQYLTFHAEATPHMDRMIHAIQDAGMKAGVSLNPSTPVSVLEDVAHLVDMILIMSVNPGFGGQSYIPNAAKKIKQAKELLRSVGNENALVEVDGGINKKTIADVANAGVDVVVAGSAVFGAEDRKDMIHYLQFAGNSGKI